MKIAVVGANNQVGTELCFRLESEGVTVVPVTRNQLGAATFGYHGFDYRVGDLADPADASQVLEDIDVVVIAAFARYNSRNDFQPKQARETNEALIENAVRHARRGATVIYFSSVAAFGDEIRDTDWWWYTREKRHLEQVLADASGTVDGRYAFRLGHVFGENQNVTDQLRDELESDQEVHVDAVPDQASNIVHTTTIADAILTAARDRPDSGTYTVTNEPNWTWEDVMTFYAPSDTTITFHGEPATGSRSPFRKLASTAGRATVYVLRSLPIEKDKLMSVSVYLPREVSEWIWNNKKSHSYTTDISEFKQENMVSMGMFDYDSAPGPYLDGLEQTADRLETATPIAYLTDE